MVPVAAALVLAAGCQPAEPPAPAESAPAEPSPAAAARREAGATAFRGVGQEPGWLLYIVPDRFIDFRYDYGEERVRTPVPEPAGEGGSTLYHAQTDAHDLSVAIEDAGCEDAMSGEEYPATVTVELDGRTFAGCGETLTADVAPGRYCYRAVTPPGGPPEVSDVLTLTVEVEDAFAHGEYDWAPAEKDARRGTFEGVLHGDTLHGTYEFMQEGRQDEAPVAIRFDGGEAQVTGGAPELGLAATLPAVDC